MTTEVDTKGKRQPVMLDADIQGRIAEYAKAYKLSQSDVIEVMEEMFSGSGRVDELLNAKREAKVSGRTSKTAILKNLSKLSAEQLEALTKMLPKEGDAQADR
jgi:hypothetical protein